MSEINDIRLKAKDYQIKGALAKRNNKLITNLEQNVTSQTDTGVVYAAAVPGGVLPYAEVTSIGGMTYKNEDALTLQASAVTAVQSNSPQEGNTLTIPPGVRALDSYGDGISQTDSNLVTWDVSTGTKTYQQIVKRIVLDGTESWSVGGIDPSITDFTRYVILNMKCNPLKAKLCSHFAYDSGSAYHADENALYSGDTTPGAGYALDFGVSKTAWETVDAWKTYLAEQNASGTPVTVVYVLPEAVETDLSDLLSDDNLINVDGATTVTAVNAYGQAVPMSVTYQNRPGEVYGVRFEGSSNSGATVTRLYNAVGLVAGVGTDTEAPQNDFDSIYPWSARRRCCGYWDESGNFVVNAYKGEPGYVEDGSNGEVWVEHSLFYYRHIYDGDAEEIAISATPLTGYSPAPIFLKNEGQDAPYQKAYTAAYPMALVDAKPTSRTGVFPNIYSLNSAMTDAKKAGDAYIVTTCAEQYTECLYMWVEFATRDPQTIMKGATSMPYSGSDTATVAGTDTNQIIVATATAADYVVGQTIGIGTSLGGSQIAENRIVTAITAYDESNSAITFDGAAVDIAVGNIVWTAGYINGTCNSVIASSGSPTSNTSGKYNCVYRGKEAPYGNVFNYISDILVQRAGDGTEDSPYTYTPYYLPDPTKYANGTITEDYVALQYNISSQDGYAKKLGIDSRYPWVRITSEIGAGSTTYYSDYYYYPRYAVCAAQVGGSWIDGSGAGPCFWHCLDAPSGASVNSRARLSYHRT